MGISLKHAVDVLREVVKQSDWSASNTRGDGAAEVERPLDVRRLLTFKLGPVLLAAVVAVIRVEPAQMLAGVPVGATAVLLAHLSSCGDVDDRHADSSVCGG